MRTQSLNNSPARIERKLNARLLPILVGLLAVLYILTGYRGWLVFLIGLGFAWLLAWTWVLLLQRGLRIERKIHMAWARVGDSVPEELIVTNTSGLPAVWVEILDEAVNLANPIRLVSDVEAHASRRRHPMHLFRRRGLYTLGPTRLQTGDPFGIYSLTIHDPHTNSVLITPPQLPLEQIRIVPGGWAGDRSRLQKNLERDISDAGVREYLPGDSLRRIHWRASAHNDSLIVRQLEAAASGDWWIFVDLQAAVQAGDGQDSTLELSVVAAASLATRALSEHRRVGLALAGPSLVWLEPRSDPAHHWQILRALAMAEKGDRSLEQLMELGRSVRSSTRIVITSTSDPDWAAGAGQRLRGSALTVLLVDPSEFGALRSQEGLRAALVRQGIPHTRLPRTLLEEAYSSRGWSRSPLAGIRSSRRYFENEQAAWQSMD